MSDFSNNTEQSRFELIRDGHMATANYRLDGSELFIDYVFSPPELRGSGTAGSLMQHIVDYASTKSLSITPICGYAKHWLNTHCKN